MIRSIVIASAVVASILVVACGGSDDVTVGSTNSTNQKLQTKTDGSPTGDGKTCSWAGTATYAQVYGNAPSAPVPTYALGDDFKSIDGCNTCTCAAQGIMCTVLACAADGGGGHACPALARICKDGSTPKLGDDCAQICPEDTIVACPADALKCPDGSFVSRTGPNCEFAACGSTGTVCGAVVKKCPDGSYVSPSGPNCAFPDCPAQESCSQLMTDASTQLLAARDANSDCTTAADCEAIVPNAACVYGDCFAAIAKAHAADYDAAKTKIEQTICAQFKSDNCGPPPTAACPAHSTIVTCNSNHKCQAQ